MKCFRQKANCRGVASMAWLAMLNPAHTLAAVNDVMPADYFPLAKGVSTLAVYVYDRDSSGPYANQAKQMAGSLETQIVALRVGHFYELAGKPLSVVAVLPWAAAKVEPAALASQLGPKVSGLADTRLGVTTWLVSNRETGRYLGMTGIVNFPTGDYDRNQILNIGENRYKATLSLGWIEPLGKSWVVEMTPEIAWYGDNSEYAGNHQLEQKPGYALTGYLRYRANKNWQFHLGGQLNAGGETTVDSVDQNNAADNPRAMLGATFTSDDRKHQWIARIARDSAIDNGFKNDSELLLRYLWIF